MTLTNQLTEVLMTEAELTEALEEALKEQQQAIVYFQTEKMAKLAVRIHELARPIAALELQRVKLVRELPGEDAEPTVSGLARELSGEERESITAMALRLKHGVERVMDMNRQNRTLLEHSLRFVRQNVRILTDDNSKQLVDHKI